MGASRINHGLIDHASSEPLHDVFFESSHVFFESRIPRGTCNSEGISDNGGWCLVPSIDGTLLAPGTSHIILYVSSDSAHICNIIKIYNMLSYHINIY